MRHILLRFADAKKPALGIHDSLVVRKADADFAEEVMTDVYQMFLLHPPLIHRA